jgi:hypothetical protein
MGIVKAKKGQTMAQARRKAATSAVARGIDFSKISDEQFQEMKKARELAVRTKEERGPLYKGAATVETFGRKSKEQQKYATEAQQAKMQEIKASGQAEAMTGMGGEAIGAEDGGAGTTNTLLQEMNSRLGNIETLLGSSLDVSVKMP